MGEMGEIGPGNILLLPKPVSCWHIFFMIRKTYLIFLWNMLLEHGFLGIFKYAWRYLAVWLGYRCRRSLSGPLSGAIALTYACNLKCVMCDLPERVNYYKNELGQPPLSTLEVKQILKDFALIGTSGISFTGGEPMLRKDLFEFIEYTKKLRMACHMTTNGWYINETTAKKLLGSGIDSISISLDGSKAEIHDAIRGVSGSFDRIINAIKILRKFKEELNKNLVINLNTVISHKNVEDILSVVDLAWEMKVDHIGFMPFHDIGLLSGNTESMQTMKLSQRDIEKLDHLIQRLICIKKETGFIESSERYLLLFRDCFQGKPFPYPCLAGYTTFVVDGHGNLSPCFPFYEMKNHWQNIRNSSLYEYWYSKELKKRREGIRSCRKCYWNCQSETSLLYQFGTPKTLSSSGMKSFGAKGNHAIPS